MAPCKTVKVLFLLAALSAALAQLPDKDRSWNALFNAAMRRADRKVSSSSSNNNNNNNNNNNINNADSNAYSVSFVPLFSFITTYLPRFFGKMHFQNNQGRRNYQNTQGRRNFQNTQGRSSDAMILSDEKTFSCETGKQQHPHIPNQFYTCTEHCLKKESNMKAETNLEIEIGESIVKVYKKPCRTITIYKCRKNFIYNDHDKRCIPEDK